MALLQEEHDLIGVCRNSPAPSVDISGKQSILAMYKQVGTVDAVVCVGGTAKFALLDTLSDDDFAFSLANKLMGQVNLVRYGVPYISPGGSVTLTSGTLAQYPMHGGAAVSTVNAGIEAFGRAAALELKDKIRVNVVSPGWVWETLEAMGRDPTKGVRAAVVAQAYQRCILEEISGQVVSVTH
jgi:NAD(P)-dependent dehydrogenase (short-subunit alcohol dehydrogenase family)